MKRVDIDDGYWSEDDGREYVRVVWPSAQGRYDELLKAGYYPEDAAYTALGEVKGLMWSHYEALEAAGF